MQTPGPPTVAATGAGTRGKECHASARIKRKTNGKFAVHIIDRVRSPHSLSAADLDGDGEVEIVVGEHDPFHPYRSKSRLYAYKKADARGLTWSRYTIDDRFEHHDGAKVVQLGPGRQAIISHGWMDSAYVHVWERQGA